jgi:hypothetical protein
VNKIYLPEDIDYRLNNAFKTFWMTRTSQEEKQRLSNVRDQGNRSAVTGGKQLDGFVSLIFDILVMNGINENNIFVDSDLELPGYYRPNKKWDLLVIDNHKLLAAIEFKSQVGPSFGNNFNNRTEEAMGSALDIWTAYREGAFGTQTAPWLGYFMILEECIRSTTAVKIRSPHFKVFEEFIDTSYKDRYELFCTKLLLERQYNAACFMTTSLNDMLDITYDMPQENLSFFTFISSMISSIL